VGQALAIEEEATVDIELAKRALRTLLNRSSAELRRCFLHLPVQFSAWMAVSAISAALSPSDADAGFTNVTASIGITHVQSSMSGAQAMTGGAAAGDFDNDGRVDLFFTRVDGTDVLYRNTGAGFVDVSAASGFTESLPTNGVAAGDVDNDGDLDLYVTGSEAYRYFLYINDGAGRFKEDAILRGASVAWEGDFTRKGQGVAFGDYDRDGYLDILTSDHSRPTTGGGSRLLRNLGAARPGHFEDVTHSAGLDVYRQPNFGNMASYRFQPQFSDIDRDGHTDIVFSSDAHTSQIFWNNGNGTFVDGTLAAGVGTDKSGMGSALADYDGDGDLDWFITAIFDTPQLITQPGNRLYRNNGDRTFTDVTTAAGVRESGWGWGTAFFDCDNDGRLDLMATDGWVALGYGSDPTKLWRNNGDGTFADVSIAQGIVDQGNGRGLLTLDYDADGDQDAVVVNYAQTPILYRNDGGGGSWLRIETRGTVSNRDGIGAVITVTPDLANPSALQIWEISAGGGYLAQSEIAAHFGLGSRTAPVDLVTILWPSGVMQQFSHVGVNGILSAVEPAPGDANGDGHVNADDLILWRQQFATTGVGLGADGDSDGDVDGADLLAWQRRLGFGAVAAAAEVVPEPPMLPFAAGVAAAVGCASTRRRRANASDPPRSRSTCASFTLVAASLVLLACAAPSASAVDIWLTTGDKSQLLKQQSDVVFLPGVGIGGTLISVVPTTTYQTISGLGAAMTDSSAWLLQNRMSAAQRDKLMGQLFSPTAGIGLNYLRVPMGASDFTASGFYTYNDSPSGGSDAAQAQFSVAHDDAYIVPRLQQARQLNPAVRLMATPWSAAAWMKTNNSLQGGSLKDHWEASFALYLQKFIEAYEQRDLPIDTITLQNEPLHTANYPTMSMTATQQARIIANHLGPGFAAADIDTEIVAYDHNWDNTAYPLGVLNDPAARPFVAGTAFHAYAGNVSAQTTVHNAYPDKDIYFTEITGGDWAPNFGDNLVWYSQNIIIGGMRNWAKTAIMWNLALDQNNNPHQGGCTDCRGVVTVNNATGAVTFNEEFYTLGQVTTAVQPDAVRIGSTTTGAVNTVAFKNPDGSRVLYALNPSTTATTLRLYENGQHLVYQLPGKSIATFRWDDGGADFDNGGFELGGYHEGGGSLDAWTVFGNLNGNVSVAAEAVHEGAESLKLFGQFTGSPNASGVSQGITVAAGAAVRATAEAYIRGIDSIAGSNNSVEMKIEFYSQYGAARSSGQFISETSTLLADGATSADAWLAHELVAVAPAGATEARLVLQFNQPDGQTGAVHLDDITFGTVVPGDFNGDGNVDATDLDTWREDFGAITSPADSDFDGDVDGADFLTWQRNLGANAASHGMSATVPEPPVHATACVLGLALAAYRSGQQVTVAAQKEGASAVR
jgi:O-glycosyl hydrolase